MQSGQLRRALLCVGEMTSKNQSSLDKTVWPLHGDAGSATLLEYNPNAKRPMQFNLGSDGSGWEAIICREVGITIKACYQWMSHILRHSPSTFALAWTSSMLYFIENHYICLIRKV